MRLQRKTSESLSVIIWLSTYGDSSCVLNIYLAESVWHGWFTRDWPRFDILQRDCCSNAAVQGPQVHANSGHKTKCCTLFKIYIFIYLVCFECSLRATFLAKKPLFFILFIFLLSPFNNYLGWGRKTLQCIHVHVNGQFYSLKSHYVAYNPTIMLGS